MTLQCGENGKAAGKVTVAFSGVLTKMLSVRLSNQNSCIISIIV